MEEEPSWLGGIVYGPQTRVGIAELRDRIPAKYPLRRYPDITHSRHCQYPVPDWDVAYAITEGREVANPRPTDQARIFRIYQQHAMGFLTYSEGVHDDVNKFVWSGLGWDPGAKVIDILRDYARYFIGEEYRDRFAQGLLALERNWRGPLLTNAAVDTTLKQFQKMEKAASPQTLLNWRFQQALYRAYYDAFLRQRLVYETALEKSAREALRAAERTGSMTAIERAEEILNRPVTEPAAADPRARVEKYKAIAVERGANLDAIDQPLNNRVFLKKRFAEIRKLKAEDERIQALGRLLGRANPGPGGFYDDLGDPANQPHLVRGPGFDGDPMFLESSLTGFGVRGLGGAGRRNMIGNPVSWWRHAEALYGAPLEMHYEGLDPQGKYRLRVVYAGDKVEPKIRLETGGGIEIHPLIERPVPFRPLEFDIPAEATAAGELRLIWHREAGLGGAGRGLQVAEVWLMRR